MNIRAKSSHIGISSSASTTAAISALAASEGLITSFGAQGGVCAVSLRDHPRDVLGASTHVARTQPDPRVRTGLVLDTRHQYICAPRLVVVRTEPDGMQTHTRPARVLPQGVDAAHDQRAENDERADLERKGRVGARRRERRADHATD